jgi:multidrug efflux pump subunit AcrB
MSRTRDALHHGPIAWMVEHKVAANLLMLVLILGGWFMSGQIKKEVFPEFEIDMVTVSVALPGASPEEVEQSLVQAIEEAVRGIEGVDDIYSTAAEGVGTVMIELMTSADRQKLYQDIQQAVDRITTFPGDAERPQVSLSNRKRGVMEIQIFGAVSEQVLRAAAEQVRDTLLSDSSLTQIELEGARELEIQIEISQATLRAHDLTLEQVATIVRQSALDRSGGKVETRGGQILLRVQERKDFAREYAAIPLKVSSAGSVIRLGDVASVREGFEDAIRSASYNNMPAIGLKIFRVGEQTPASVSEAARRLLPDAVVNLPPDVQYVISDDDSAIYQQRLDLLLKNAFFGLLLVLFLLSLFLEFKLAFWVAVGIPVSFLGAMLFLPFMGASINMISMFAFIIALGIVVDDAIIVGENIYEYRQRGMAWIDAAIQGARDIAVPISFSILTNIIAFLPLAFMPGGFGKFWAVIPLVVGVVFVISWVEALLVLPSHVAHMNHESRFRWSARLHARQQVFSVGFNRFVERYYGAFIRAAVARRYLTVALGIALLLVVLALPLSGRMGFILMPAVESDKASATVVMPVGTPDEWVQSVRRVMVEKGQQMLQELPSGNPAKGIFAVVQDNTIDVRIYLLPPEERTLGTAEVAQRWRDAVGEIAGAEYVRFASDRGGPGHGASVTVELRHQDVNMLNKASIALAEKLGEFSNTKDIDDGYTPGKRQLDFRLTPEARSAGLTASGVGTQVRNAYFGAEALRQQRGRNEVKVMVKLPEAERSHLHDVETLLLRTANGGFVPLAQAVEIDYGRAYTQINRRNGQRTVNVTANVEPVSDSNRIIATLQADVLPTLQRDFPGLGYSFEGHQASMRDALMSFVQNVTLTLIAMYILLAIPFRSYIQPAIVMVSIPFGVVGAIIGHLIMGFSISIISIMGIIALTGVVVNDSLVMIDYANRLRLRGESAVQAIVNAGIRRFRPIMLTTITTFGGLAPMIFETSRQARFMIPMAISLGYGILFATAIMLVLIPCLYMVIEDIRTGFRSPDKAANPLHDPA